MTRTELNRQYFKWLCRLVRGANDRPKGSFQKLLRALHQAEFYYILPMDDNRGSDGIDLRYRFGYENEVDGREVASYLDDRPCSVLEMLLALSIRIDEHLLYDPEFGDRPAEWFWRFIRNLGLDAMTDDNYDELKVETAIENFLERKYSKTGAGGSIVYLPDTTKDIRGVDIWCQVMWYINRVCE